MAAISMTAATASAEFPDIQLLSVEVASQTPALPDTVMSIKNATNVIITESPAGLKMTVKGTDNDPEFQSTYISEFGPDAVVKSHQEFEMPYLFRTRNYSTNQIVMFKGLHAGFCGTIGTPGSMDVQMGKSFEIGIDNLIAYELRLKGDRDAFSLGLGINWRNYRMTAETRFIEQDGIITTSAYPENTEGRYSRLKIFSLGFPLMYEHRFPINMLATRSMIVNIGAIFNWNSYGSMKTAWKEADGTKAEQFSKRIGQRKFTVDIMAAVQVAPASGFYVKYSPMDFFKKGRGPEFQTISTGIYLLF